MVTINDVARLADVFRGAVSNVVNHVKVRPEYQEKVGRVIKNLGYVLNAYARSLKSNRTHIMALIPSIVRFPFFPKLADDMEQGLCHRGYKLLLCNSQNDYHLELEYASMAKENKVGGILSITYSDITPHVADVNIPVAVIGRYFDTHIPFVSTNNFQGGAIVAQKLLEPGCRWLAPIGRFSDKNGIIRLRWDGPVGYYQENDIPLIELYSGSNSQESILETDRFVEQEFKNNAPWGGVFTAAGRYVERTIGSLRSHSCPVVPDHTLQIIGFDGTKSHVDDRIWIPSIHQFVEGIAVYAADTLCRQIAGEEIEYYKLFPVTSVQGKTIHIQGGLILLIYLLVT